ncbi:unnamed protein product, partial [Brachionus calyciflorus]
ENLVNWIKAFLTGRRQRVVLGELGSNWVDVTSCVPSGSVLGPILFIIFIDDMLELIYSSCKAYADGTKIISIIKNFDLIVKLKDDLDKISKWFYEWSAQLNADKCKVVHFGNSNTKFDYDIKSENSDIISSAKS